MTTRIRRYVETDTGHRVPNHKSKCRHMHGHRYRFEAEIEGDTVQSKYTSAIFQLDTDKPEEVKKQSELVLKELPQVDTF